MCMCYFFAAIQSVCGTCFTLHPKATERIGADDDDVDDDDGRFCSSMERCTQVADAVAMVWYCGPCMVFSYEVTSVR